MSHCVTISWGGFMMRGKVCREAKRSHVGRAGEGRGGPCMSGLGRRSECPEDEGVVCEHLLCVGESTTIIRGVKPRKYSKIKGMFHILMCSFTFIHTLSFLD